MEAHEIKDPQMVDPTQDTPQHPQIVTTHLDAVEILIKVAIHAMNQPELFKESEKMIIDSAIKMFLAPKQEGPQPTGI